MSDIFKLLHFQKAKFDNETMFEKFKEKEKTQIPKSNKQKLIQKRKELYTGLQTHRAKLEHGLGDKYSQGNYISFLQSKVISMQKQRRAISQSKSKPNFQTAEIVMDAEARTQVFWM